MKRREKIMFKIKFTLGDWSGDGHSINKEFIFESNKPVQDVREAHFRFEKIFGFDIGKLCSEYGECWLTKDMYYKLQDILKWNIDEDLTEEWWKEENDKYYPDTDELAWIWAKCLMVSDTELTLKSVNDSIPTLHFFGYDNQGRHLNTPGYGLFE